MNTHHLEISFAGKLENGTEFSATTTIHGENKAECINKTHIFLAQYGYSAKNLTKVRMRVSNPDLHGFLSAIAPALCQVRA